MKLSLLYKKLFIFFAVLQLFSVQLIAETTSHIVCTSGWRGESIAKAISDELQFAQEQAYSDNKFFKLGGVSITLDGYAFIHYKISDKVGETNPFLIKVAHVSAWTAKGITEELQAEINSLQDSAFNENKIFNIIDVLILPGCQHGYIIYEISR